MSVFVASEFSLGSIQSVVDLTHEIAVQRYRNSIRINDYMTFSFIETTDSIPSPCLSNAKLLLKAISCHAMLRCVMCVDTIIAPVC